MGKQQNCHFTKRHAQSGVGRFHCKALAIHDGTVLLFACATYANVC